ncbi:MAG: YcfL family protein [Kiritimatiellae bacterium]|nr:YcfL family protein [Kiritimatiellia bacterium]
MKKSIAWLLMACGLAFCAGCLGPNTAGLSAERGRLVVEDRAFASRVELVQDQTVMLDGGFLKAQVTLRNTWKRDARVQYRFTWKDRNGMTLKRAETPWKVLPLHGREEAVLEGICPVPKAADFRLVVRPVEGH